MKTVFGLACIILAAHQAAADCSALRSYSTEFVPACDSDDIYVKWPNYANQSTYYSCIAVGKARLTPCPSGQYFTFVYQQCTQCSDYIPAVPCSSLKTQNSPKCVPIGSGGESSGSPSTASTAAPTYPTPKYPTTVTTTTKATTTTTTTTKSANTTATTATTATTKTPATTTSTATTTTTTAFPGPPSPVTSNPDVPVPPTPAPTPPSIELTPPTPAVSVS